MLKKSLIITFIFCSIIFLSSTVFGSNFVNDAKTGLENMGNGIKNVVQDVTNSAKDVKNDMTNSENTVENRADDMTMGGTTDRGYTATRTDSTTTGYTANNATVWVILAIAGAIIIALVWYYSMQTEDRNNNH